MTYPMRRRSISMLTGVICEASKSIVPESGGINPMMTRSSVDFPQPLGPISTVVLPRSIDRSVGCRADANVAFITRSAPPTGRRLQFCGEIENAKPAAVISPHSNKLKSCLAGESDKALRRVFVGIFSDDFLARMEMKLPVFHSHSLIDFADEIDLDPAFVRIVNRVMPPMS